MHLTIHIGNLQRYDFEYFCAFRLMELILDGFLYMEYTFLDLTSYAS
jgi:hypothetical protein